MPAITFILLAQVQVQVQVPVPTIVFPAPPPLVVVEPGLQVVEDNDDEIFFHTNYYWVQRDGRWFRSPHHKGGWVLVDGPLVPPLLVKQPKGKWKKFRRGGPPPPPPQRHDDDDDDHGRGNGKGKGKGKKR